MSEKIYCDQCGAEMKLNQRCCIKCGRINYRNAENASMLKYANNSNDSYVVGSGSNFSTDLNKNYSLTKNIGDRKSCIMLNLGILLLFNVVSFLLIYLETYDIQKTLTSLIFILNVLVTSILVFESISLQFIYMKANKPYWSALVPYYNLYVFFEISMGSGLLFLISLIPIVGTIFYFVGVYHLAKKFRRSSAFCILLYPIAIPVIAFNSADRYDDTYYVQNTGVHVDVNNYIIKEYKSNKILLRFFLVLIAGSLFALGYFHHDFLLFLYKLIKEFILNIFKKILIF